MQPSDIESIAVIYGKKQLVEEFLENFHTAKRHDDAPINAFLVSKEMEEYLRHYVWKGS